jgi:hypothetical protein
MKNYLQFNLKTLFFCVILTATFCAGFISGGGRERQLVKKETERLGEKAIELTIRENRIAKHERSLGIQWCGTPDK